MDELFLRFVRGIFMIMLLYGLGMTAVILFGDENIGLRMVSTFGSMFAGILGLGSGYLLGRSDSGKAKENEERRPHDRSSMGPSG
jgi:hypothetical protein